VIVERLSFNCFVFIINNLIKINPHKIAILSFPHILKTQRYRLELSKATASKFRLITSAVGTTLLHSPGCNEGKARNETLGKQRGKR